MEVLWLVTKVFSTKFRGRTHFGDSIGSTSEQSAEVFSCEILILVRVRVGVREFPPILQKSFLPRKFLKLHCMMVTHHSCLHVLYDGYTPFMSTCITKNILALPNGSEI